MEGENIYFQPFIAGTIPTIHPVYGEIWLRNFPEEMHIFNFSQKPRNDMRSWAVRIKPCDPAPGYCFYVLLQKPLCLEPHAHHSSYVSCSVARTRRQLVRASRNASSWISGFLEKRKNWPVCVFGLIRSESYLLTLNNLGIRRVNRTLLYKIHGHILWPLNIGIDAEDIKVTIHHALMSSSGPPNSHWRLKVASSGGTTCSYGKPKMGMQASRYGRVMLCSCSLRLAFYSSGRPGFAWVASAWAVNARWLGLRW